MVLTLKVKVKVNEFKVPNLIISILGKEETCLKFWMTLEQSYGFDLEGQGQGPKFNHSYSRQRQNFSEIMNDIAAKLWFWPWR